MPVHDNLMEKTSKIYIAGHTGLAGSAVMRLLTSRGYTNLLVRTHAELELEDTRAVSAFFDAEKTDVVIMCAARVGGIKANSMYPADFLYENLQMQNNVLWSAHRTGVQKLVFLSSACVYPNDAPQPVKEEYLLTGPPAVAHEAYAVAKIAGMMLCRKLSEQYGEKFVSLVPTNLYGPNDNFDPEGGHVVPGLMRRMHEAKERGDRTLSVWGTGNVRREFLHADDLASAIMFLLEKYESPEFINVGVGEDISIRELAEKIKDVVGYEGKLDFDATKPEGPQRRWLDSGKVNALGWKPSIPLNDGLRATYEWFTANHA